MLLLRSHASTTLNSSIVYIDWLSGSLVLRGAIVIAIFIDLGQIDASLLVRCKLVSKKLNGWQGIAILTLFEDGLLGRRVDVTSIT